MDCLILGFSPLGHFSTCSLHALLLCLSPIRSVLVIRGIFWGLWHERFGRARARALESICPALRATHEMLHVCALWNSATPLFAIESVAPSTNLSMIFSAVL